MTISDILNASGLSQTELANHFGIPLRTVQNWAEGTRQPSEWVVELIDKVFKTERKLNMIINREKLFAAIKTEVLDCLKYNQRKLYKIDDDGDLIESDERHVVQLVIDCRNFNFADYDIEAVNGFTSDNMDEVKDEVIKEFFENDNVTDDDINTALGEIIKDGESMLVFN